MSKIPGRGQCQDFNQLLNILTIIGRGLFQQHQDESNDRSRRQVNVLIDVWTRIAHDEVGGTFDSLNNFDHIISKE